MENLILLAAIIAIAVICIGAFIVHLGLGIMVIGSVLLYGCYLLAEGLE